MDDFFESVGTTLIALGLLGLLFLAGLVVLEMAKMLIQFLSSDVGLYTKLFFTSAIFIIIGLMFLPMNLE